MLSLMECMMSKTTAQLRALKTCQGGTNTMADLYNPAEKTASENQVKASVRTMLGIMEHHKEIELPKDKKQMTKLLKEAAVPAFERHLASIEHTWTSGNTTTIMSMSRPGWDKGTYEYKPEAEVPLGAKECLIAAVTGQAFEAEEAPKEELTKAQITAAKKKAAKEAKAAKAAMAKAPKEALTAQAKKKPEDSKPFRAVVTDDMKDKWAARGMSPTEIAEMAFDIVKANS